METVKSVEKDIDIGNPRHMKQESQARRGERAKMEMTRDVHETTDLGEENEMMLEQNIKGENKEYRSDTETKIESKEEEHESQEEVKPEKEVETGGNDQTVKGNQESLGNETVDKEEGREEPKKDTSNRNRICKGTDDEVQTYLELQKQNDDIQEQIKKAGGIGNWLDKIIMDRKEGKETWPDSNVSEKIEDGVETHEMKDEKQREEKVQPVEFTKGQKERNRDEESGERVLIIGDSMLNHLDGFLETNGYKKENKPEREIVCMRGANISQKAERVKKTKMGQKGGILIIQGGGNNLIAEGAVLTWMKIVEAIKVVWKNNKEVTVGVVAVTRRPGEEKQFEIQRVRLEQILEEEIERWSVQKRERGVERCMEGISFLGMEKVIKNRDVGADGIHLSWHGCNKFYHKIAEFIEICEERRKQTKFERQAVWTKSEQRGEGRTKN